MGEILQELKSKRLIRGGYLQEQPCVLKRPDTNRSEEAPNIE